MELAVLTVELIENVVKLVELIKFVGELAGLDEEMEAMKMHSKAKQAANPLPLTAEHISPQFPQLKGSVEKS
jgi:hypothetical protein